MKLSFELKKRGITKKALADLLGVSRQTVMRMGEEVSEKVLAVIKDHEILHDAPMMEREQDWDSASLEFIEAMIKRRGGLEADTDRVLETDWEIAHSVGWKVHEFYRAIDRWVSSRKKEGASK